MCMQPETERHADMDETAEWGASHLRDKVVPIRPLHELEQHVQPVPSRPFWVFFGYLLGDVALLWSMQWTRVKAWASRIDRARVLLWLTCVCVVAVGVLSAVCLGASLGFPPLQHLADFIGLPHD